VSQAPRAVQCLSRFCVELAARAIMLIMMFEPLPSPDDTQPTQPLLTLDDTQPTQTFYPTAKQSWSKLLLLVIIVMSSLSVLLTLEAIIRYPGTQSTLATPINRQVTLVLDGAETQINSTAQTVADLLQEQEIELAVDDWLSTSPDVLLVDGMRIALNRARDVELTINGRLRRVRTSQQQPRLILDEAGIALNNGDRIWIDGTEMAAESLDDYPLLPQSITIRAAHPITIIDGIEQTNHWTTADTVGDALFQAGITLYLSDQVMPDLSTTVQPDMEITITRAQLVRIEVDDTVIESRVMGRTVSDALAETGVALVGLDYTIPAENTPIVPGMKIRVLRVTESIITEQETIPYETIYQDDPTLPLDTREIQQAGQTGITEYTIRVRYENGYEISREVIETTVEQVARNEVIAYGTDIVLGTIETPEGPREYWRKLRLYATSYKPEAVGGSTTTAIGMTLEKGVVGAHPSIIPYRTQLFVPGYGVGVMGDTGHGLGGTRYWIDLGYSDADWVNWHEYVDVYLLTPIPENINYLLPEP